MSNLLSVIISFTMTALGVSDLMFRNPNFVWKKVVKTINSKEKNGSLRTFD